ncbi:unnamed protein product [Paramecium octaurelia]|uniref:Uncharacterized protein n=1 Tax=Paramecium octaurelia TaxID=43137 RepID=A0A8S1YE95_PAROT|nr:unnamed protein product [Paramecium octaurelia]
MGGGQSSITSTIQGSKGSVLISFYNMDQPTSQSHQSTRISEESTINNIIEHIKDKNDCQNVNLYYDDTPIDDLSFLFIYEYIDLLPRRSFGYKINQMQQQNINLIQNDKQQNQKINQQQQSQLGSTNQKKLQGEAHGDQSQQNSQVKASIKNNSNLNEKKQGPSIVISPQNNQVPINEDEIQKQRKSVFLINLIKHIQQKYIEAKQLCKQQLQELQNKNNQLEVEKKNMSQIIEDLRSKNQYMYNDYNKIKQDIEELQNRNKNLESELQKSFNKNDLTKTTIQSNLSKGQSAIMFIQSQAIEKQQPFQNKCGHYLDKEKIQNILKQSLANKTIAYCDQCKPTKISNQILIKIESLGQAYKEFQANEELKQLMNNLKAQKKTIYKCSRNNCSFYCIFNKSVQISPENSFCPFCLIQGMKISE